MTNRAFTLAEVLITLGVIGVVAAITIPTLIQNYQKQVTVNRLKETYSILEQAVKMSEIDNGDVTEWQYPKNTEQSHIDWINKYLAPYMKNVTVKAGGEDSASADIILANGTIIDIWNGNNENNTQVHAHVYFTKKDKAVSGKNVFTYYIGYGTNEYCLFKDKKGVRPYDYTGGFQNDDIRKILRDAPTFGCNEESRGLCAALIMHDGWQIKDDYKW